MDYLFPSRRAGPDVLILLTELEPEAILGCVVLTSDANSIGFDTNSQWLEEISNRENPLDDMINDLVKGNGPRVNSLHLCLIVKEPNSLLNLHAVISRELFLIEKRERPSDPKIVMQLLTLLQSKSIPLYPCTRVIKELSSTPRSEWKEDVIHAIHEAFDEDCDIGWLKLGTVDYTTVIPPRETWYKTPTIEESQESVGEAS